jgi:hypothetical protein
MSKIKYLVIPLALGVSGCLSAVNYETEPVVVSTAQGPVTCQFYTRQQVTWDRSIARPEEMSVQVADAICVNEGLKRSR